MSHKTSPARRAAFLKALGETGNQTLSAERAKVSRSWVQLHRSADPAFDAACKAAIAEAKESLAWAPDQVRGARGSSRPPRGWGHLDGEELVVRGSNARRLQIARARLHQWTPRVEARFLAVLAATCNVRAACAAVGMSVASAYRHRRRWPGFARRWDEAVAVGYGVIEGGLAAGAIALLDPEVPPFEPPVVAPMSVDDAIRLVRVYERRAREADRAWYRERRAGAPAREARGQVRTCPPLSQSRSALSVAIGSPGTGTYLSPALPVPGSPSVAVEPRDSVEGLRGRVRTCPRLSLSRGRTARWRRARRRRAAGAAR